MWSQKLFTKMKEKKKSNSRNKNTEINIIKYGGANKNSKREKTQGGRLEQKK
jgi:hypothetical protein